MTKIAVVEGIGGNDLIITSSVYPTVQDALDYVCALIGNPEEGKDGFYWDFWKVKLDNLSDTALLKLINYSLENEYNGINIYSLPTTDTIDAGGITLTTIVPGVIIGKFERGTEVTEITPVVKHSIIEYLKTQHDILPILFYTNYYGGCGECSAIRVREVEFGQILNGWDLD